MSLRGLGLLPFATAACFALSAAMLTTFPIIAPYVVSELGLSYGEAGAIATAYMFGYGLFQVPASMLGMRLGGGRVLLSATALMCVSALSGALIGSAAAWIGSRLLLGMGGAAVLPLSLHLLTRSLGGKRLVKGISIFVSGWGVGMTLALLGAAPVLHAFGWREVMLASAAAGFLVLILLWRSLPAREREDGERIVIMRSLGRLVLALGWNRRLNLMGLVNAAGTTTMVCVPGWLPLYLTKDFGTSPAEVSVGLAPVGIAIVLGGWSGGVLAIRMGWRPVVVASFLVSAALVALIPLLPGLVQVVGVVVLVGWAAMLFPGPIQSLFPSVVSTEWTALAAGYYNTVGFVGAFVASLLFGILVEWCGSFALGWLWLALAPLVGAAGALSLAIPSSIEGGRPRAAEGRTVGRPANWRRGLLRTGRRECIVIPRRGIAPGR